MGTSPQDRRTGRRSPVNHDTQHDTQTHTQHHQMHTSTAQAASEVNDGQRPAWTTGEQRGHDTCR